MTDAIRELRQRVKALELWRESLTPSQTPPPAPPPPVPPQEPPPPPPSGETVNVNGGVAFRIGDEHDQTIDLGGKTYENAKVGIAIENGERSDRMAIGNGRILNPESNGCYLYDIRDSTVSDLILEGSRDERPLRVPNASRVVFEHLQCIGKNDKSAAWFLGSTEIKDTTVRHSLFKGGEVRYGVRPQDSHLGAGKVTMAVEDSTFERTSGNHMACIHAWGDSSVTHRRCVFKPNGRRIMDIDDTCGAYPFQGCWIEEDSVRRPMVEADKARMKGAVDKVSIT